MAKRTPKYIIEKIDRMNRLMQQVVDLNFELEEWLEANGIEDGFDFTFDQRDDRGYGIIDVGEFVKDINEAIS